MARSKEFDEKVVLDKAMRLFWEKGYEKTSMTDLVDHMGIHRRSLYDTFGDKHTLYLQVMDRFGYLIYTSLQARIKYAKKSREALQLIFDYFIQGEEDSPAGCLFVNSAVELATSDREVHAKTMESLKKIEHMLMEIITTGQTNGEFTSECDAEELAEYLHNVLVGIRVMVKTSVPKEKLYRIAERSIKMLEK
ncbi:TetR/AcrR family transcriptional regulator [Bacillus sp. NPDC077027]|uniref:TetR/AcrR family transcriptional regulator n=1 Tax=Bacillus sp. NPDC077027 TaxID=3390548 RepID=UPI003D058720